jgi:putative DNA primase/helicase
LAAERDKEHSVTRKVSVVNDTTTNNEVQDLVTRIRAAIPKELIPGQAWVGWKRVRKSDGTIAKVPMQCNPDKPSPASPTDPETWGYLDEACAAVQAHKLAGVGRVFHDDSDIMGIDLDKCRDVETGQLTEWAQKIVDAFETYTEVSPSGTGVKLFLRGKKPGPANRRDNVEFYDTDRYFTVTGQHLSKTPKRLNRPAPEIVEAFYASALSGGETASPNGSVETPELTGRATSPPMEDKEILSLLAKDKGGELFRAVYYHGDLSEWDGNRSQADFYLARRIAFYTQDATQVGQIFDGSALAKREKWTERPDYRERTINKAISETKDVFVPKKTAKKAKGGDDEKIKISDLANMMILQSGGNLCYSMGQWMEYKDGVWRPVDTIMVEKRGVDITLAVEATGLIEYNWGTAVQVNNTVQRLVAKPSDIWDRDPNKLALTNGTLDLDTLELRPHDPLDYATSGVPHAYDRDAVGPNWDRLIEYLRAHLGEDVVDFLQEYYGYCLTAETGAELMLFLKGPRGSGKSTLSEGIQAMLGPDMFLSRSLAGLQERFGRADLIGKRLVVSTEMSQLKLLETEMIDNIISGEPITMERKNRDPFTYRPIAKLIQASNYLPQVPNTNAGIYRRLKVVEFPALQAKKDESLKLGIRNEGAHVLNWSLEGLRRLRERGTKFQVPHSVEAASTLWHHQNNTVAAFFADCLEPGTHSPRTSQIHALYGRWCKEHGHGQMAINKFMEHAREEPFVAQRLIRPKNVARLSNVDLTEEGTRINENSFKPVFTYAEC